MRQRKFFLSPENDIKYNWKNTNERRLYYKYKYEYYIKKERWRIMEFLLNTEKLISKQSNQRKIEETLFVNRNIV